MVPSTLALVGLTILPGLTKLPEPARAVDADLQSRAVADADTLRVPEERPATLVDVLVVTPGRVSALTSVAPQEQPRRFRRTVFWPDTTNDIGTLDAGVTTPLIAEDAFYAAPWLLHGGMETADMGEVAGFAGAQEIRVDRPSARPFDRLMLRVGERVPAVGARLRSYRIERSIVGVGSVVVPSGVLTVEAVTGDGILARVDQVYERLFLGDRIQALPEYPRFQGSGTTPVMGGPEATIVAFLRDHQLYAPGQYVFLDAGSAQGVALGDEFDVVWDGSGDGVAEGSIQVIAVQDNGSTGRIVELENPVFELGVRVRLSRRLQR